MDSFFGSFVYDRVVPRDHFLVPLNQVMDWDSFTELLLPTYHQARGRGNEAGDSVSGLQEPHQPQCGNGVDHHHRADGGPCGGQ